MLVFSHDKQTARGMCDVNERRSNPQEHEDWSVSQRRKTRPTDVAFHLTNRKGYQRKLLAVH